MNQENSFLGRGWSFPPTFERGAGGLKMSESIEDIRESIWIILSTRRGERIMDLDFGCGIHDMVFEEMDTTMTHQIKNLVEDALLTYEPRIDVLEVKVAIDNQLEGLVNIEIDYEVRQVNTRYNIVYPFYFMEGTDIKD